MQSPPSEIEDARDREMSDHGRREINNAGCAREDRYPGRESTISPSFRIHFALDEGAAEGENDGYKPERVIQTKKIARQ